MSDQTDKELAEAWKKKVDTEENQKIINSFLIEEDSLDTIDRQEGFKE
ncbi:hypothetical protein SAMN05216389_13612 [Oceanobacillus limi]|uniref:Uncharacterized protein n=1 Tax=Oceanobacillus limi TaxID=930131 RepID=A0A1I0HIV2_9BACI|nr:hypothetical protein [Oceanobacillus limi]SET83768.1 hypothetical protein SAMN05216389_13612 [Oceanobacillus limi]